MFMKKYFFNYNKFVLKDLLRKVKPQNGKKGIFFCRVKRVCKTKPPPWKIFGTGPKEGNIGLERYASRLSRYCFTEA